MWFSVVYFKVLSTTIRVITVVKMLWTHEAHAKPHSICFLPQYQGKEVFVLTIEHTDSYLKVHALHYANELLVPSDSFKNFCKLA